MNGLTLDLLERMKSLIPEESGWFNTIKEWYKNAKFTRRLIEELRSDEETALLSMRVGATSLAEPPEWQGRHVHWVIPTGYLSTGRNRLQIALDGDAQAPLFLDASIAGQDEGLAHQTIHLTVKAPQSTHYLELCDSVEARHQNDCWAVFPGGSLSFYVHLASCGPVHFTLRLPEGRSLPWPKTKTERRQKLLEDVIDKVKDRVEEKMKSLEAELRQARQNRGDLESDLNDLRAYEELHRKQIEKLVHAAASITLDYVIRETGMPDDLIRRYLPKTVTPVAPQPAPPVALRPTPPTPSAVAPVASSGSMFGKLVFIAAFVSTAMVGYNEYLNGNLQAPAWLNGMKLPGGGGGGNIMIALRKASDDLGWKRDAEKELPKEKIMAMVKGLGDLIGQNAEIPPLDANARLYFVGERQPNAPPELEALTGMPPCRKALVVYDLRNKDVAAAMFETMQKNTRAGWNKEIMKNLGITGEIVRLDVPGSDDAVAIVQKSALGPLATTSWARSGTHLYSTIDVDALPVGTEVAEHQKRLCAISDRMRELQ